MFKFYFNFKVGMCVLENAGMSASVHRVQEGASDPLELELQVGHPAWVQAVEPGSPARAVRTFNH